MPIINLQKRARELGRIRLGQQQTFTRKDGSEGTKPVKLDRFRLTSASQPLLERAAEIYGGQVRPWTPNGGSPQFEVITDARRLPIMVPPNQPVSQWFEAWRKSGCVHRCDGVTNVLTDEPCDPEDPIHQEATDKPTTRLSVVLRDVEGIGVWRVETHGWNAAVELPDVAEFLAQAGGYVEGYLALEQRTSIIEVNGKPQTSHYVVPIIEIDVTPAELMAGRGRVETPQLEGPVPQSRAIESPADPYAPYFEAVDAATSIDEISTIWKRMAGEALVGSNATPSPRATQFVDAFKARAEQVKPTNQPPTGVPDADGAYEAELVPDGESGGSNAALPAESGDADAVWAEVLKAGGQLGMTLDAVADDFAQQMGGLSANEASAAELQQYLDRLRTQGAAA